MNVFWGVVALVGAIVFLVGANSNDASQVWSIYLVNLVFWSGLAATGPAIAGMLQVPEARWSPSVRRIALTTAGFLPVAVVLFLVLFAGQALATQPHNRTGFMIGFGVGGGSGGLEGEPDREGGATGKFRIGYSLRPDLVLHYEGSAWQRQWTEPEGDVT